MQYTVIECHRWHKKCKDKEEFLKEITDLLNNGWELAGGIGVAYLGTSEDFCYAQALIKR